MTHDDRARYLAAYEAAWPGELRYRGDEEQWEIAEWMRSVETADSVGLAARHLYDAGYAEATPEEPDRCVRYARTIRAALGIVDPPEPVDVGERLAAVEKERDEARAERDRLREELSEAVQAAAIGEAVIAAMHGEPVSDFLASMWPVAEAQSLHHTIALYQGDVAALDKAVKGACEPLRLLEDDDSDWPKLPGEVARVVAERDALAATLARVRDVLAEYRDPDPDSSEAWLAADIREALGETVEPYWTDDGREPRLGLHVWQSERGWVYSTDNVPAGDRAFGAWLAAQPVFETEQEAKDAAVAAVKESE